jgi:hypothetical protein
MEALRFRAVLSRYRLSVFKELCILALKTIKPQTDR